MKFYCLKYLVILLTKENYEVFKIYLENKNLIYIKTLKRKI